MGFYGNITNTSKTQFQFDLIYPNRFSMDANCDGDGIYTGRYVLVEYDSDFNTDDFLHVYIIDGKMYTSPNGEPSTELKPGDVEDGAIVWTADSAEGEVTGIVYSNIKFYQITIAAGVLSFKELTGVEGNPNYTVNYNIDVAEYGAGRGYDSTVWQKTFVSGVEKYIMIAELNSVVPTFDVSADAPTTAPLTPHFDAQSTDIYYKLHWQPSWGFRIAESADGERITKSKDSTYYPSDEQVGYDDVSYKGAIYYNKDGFNKEKHHMSTDRADQIAVSPSGISGNKYNKHDGTLDMAEAPDIQEMRIILPSLGNALCELWDIVYDYDKDTNKRSQDISWKDANEAKSGTRNPETLAGCINITHDLLGMIITDSDPVLTEEEYNKKLIYKKEDKYYRIAQSPKYTTVEVQLPVRENYNTIEEYNVAYQSAINAAMNSSGYSGNDWYIINGNKVRRYNRNAVSGITETNLLGYQNGYEYKLVEIQDFAGKLGTVNGAILQLKNLLEVDDPETRDRSTVQGAINSLNDILDTFEDSSSGGYNTISINGKKISSIDSQGAIKVLNDNWITTSIDNDQKAISFSHAAPNQLETLSSTISYVGGESSLNFGDKFQIPVIKYDSKGHIAEVRTNNIQIPAPSLTGVESTNASVITNITLSSTSGAFNKISKNIGELFITGYEDVPKPEDVEIKNIDTVNGALKKLETYANNINLGVSNLEEEFSQEVKDRDQTYNEIIKALSQKTRFVENIILLASGWSGLVQVVSTSNLLEEDDTPHITLAEVSSETREGYGLISQAETFTDSDGQVKLKFTCLEEVPTVDLVLQVEVIRL